MNKLKSFFKATIFGITALMAIPIILLAIYFSIYILAAGGLALVISFLYMAYQEDAEIKQRNKNKRIDREASESSS